MIYLGFMTPTFRFTLTPEPINKEEQAIFQDDLETYGLDQYVWTCFKSYQVENDESNLSDQTNIFLQIPLVNKSI